MATDNSTVKLGPNGKPVRPFVLPSSFGGKLKVWRYIIYRRLVQLTTLLLFFGTAHWGWTIAGEPLLMGNLSSSTLLGVIPLADPFAVLQIFLTQHVLEDEVIIGAGTLVPPGKVLESGYLYVGSPVRQARKLTDSELSYFDYTSQKYVDLAAEYLARAKGNS